MRKRFLALLVILGAGLLLLQSFPSAPQIQAEFEVAGIAHENRIPFSVKLSNKGHGDATDLTVVATAGDTILNLAAPILEAGEEKTVSGELLLEGGEGSVEFSARVLGDGVSFRSDVVRVARPDGDRGGNNLYSQIPIQQQSYQSKSVQVPIQMGDVPTEPDLALDETAYGKLEPVEPGTDVEQLISRVEDYECGASRHTLEVYQQMGNSKADQFLISKL